MITVEDAARLEELTRGQIITDLLVANDDSSVQIHLKSGDLLIVSAELIPRMSVPATLEMELQQK